MRIFARIIIVLLVVVLISGVIAAGFGLWTVRRSFPQTDGTAQLVGLSANVEVIRDERIQRRRSSGLTCGEIHSLPGIGVEINEAKAVDLFRPIGVEAGQLPGPAANGRAPDGPGGRRAVRKVAEDGARRRP